MTASTLSTASVSTTQRGFRDYAIDHIVLHHCASTDINGVLNMMVSGSREVSANYVVKDGQIVSVVPEEYRSWSLSSNLWDGRSVTFEICNESVGGSWPVSSASHESVARVVADIAKRYSIPINRDRILGHREVYERHGASYATACPGGLDMDWIVARANQLANGGGNDDMRVIKNINNTGKPSATGTEGWTVLLGEFTFYHHPDANSQRMDSRVWMGSPDTVDPLNEYEFAYAMKSTLDRIAERDRVWGGGSSGGVSPDLKPVIDLINSLDVADKARDQKILDAIAALPKPPTTFKAA